MPDSSGDQTDPQNAKQENSPRKRIRHRKKQLYENILKQMEFYFSDASLTKDRFLGELVRKDPFVSLEIFLKFNKIRSLTQDTNDIAKAMKHSTMLELSEDRLKVKRKTSLQPYNADLRTIYVESIPVTASLEWVERVFSDYGPVAYISLPKFKKSQRIKGYAFIEFKTAEDAQNCLSTFTKMGCKLPTCMPPEELSSIKMFSMDEPDELLEKQEEKVYEPPRKKKRKEKKPQKGLDLKLEHYSDSDKKADDTPTDETKSITTPSEDESKSIVTPTEENKTLDVESKDELTSQDEGKPGTDQDTPRKKKSRKRSKEKTKGGMGKNEAPKGALWGLQVLAKAEWKTLRNKYLNLQRKYMQEMKTQVRMARRHCAMPDPHPQPTHPSVPADAAGIQPSKLERLLGVFVKEILPEPCLDVRLTKRTIRSNVHALHVDVKEGQNECIIRFDSANAANEYCANASNVARVLSASEEEEQWSRAESARAQRRPRGRCKILAHHDKMATDGPALTPASPQPTHTHIRFDDE